ncbi:MAG: helix-turn-helix domain-containing protein [Acidimicrobiales bacterium]
MLREARERRGLDLVTVHDRLARPITQLEALEAGDLQALPDQASALSTLRRYAAFLTLDGDALALQMMETWSAVPAAPSRRRFRETAGLAGMVTAVTTGPEHLRAFTQTGQVPRIPGFATSSSGNSGAYGYGLEIGPPTGMISASPAEDFRDVRDVRRSIARARRRRRAPTALKLTTWLVALLVLVAIAGAIVQRNRPHWMIQAHLVHIVEPGGATRAAPTGHRAGTTAPNSSRRRVAPASVTPGPTNRSTRATYIVSVQHFTLRVAASAPCYVEVTSPASINPLLVGELQAGQARSFNADKSITLQVDSSYALIGIFVNGKNVFTTTPRIAPFFYTFTSRP